MTPVPTQSNGSTAMRSFLLSVLPTGTAVIAGQPNRVAEPRSDSFVVMTAIRFKRLRTNIDSAEDVRFTASIAAALMTVTDVSFGVIEVGATIFGVGVTAGTTVISFGTGSGGIGTYNVSQAQTVTSETMSSGAKSAEQGAELTFQLDFHSADLSTAGDMAETVSTLMRDDYAMQQFAEQSPNYGLVPLYADDPRQMPFSNEAQQIEWRWVVEAALQSNILVSVPTQYADSLDIDLVDVDVVFPPT